MVSYVVTIWGTAPGQWARTAGGSHPSVYEKIYLYPVTMAGMIAANVLRGYSSVVHWGDMGSTDAMILDVREPREFQKGGVAGAVNVPLDELRPRMSELPRDRDIWIHCLAGQRSYVAERILKQCGFTVRNLSGGYRMFRAVESIVPPS